MFHPVTNLRQISLEKMATALRRLTSQELDALEELLDDEITNEVLARANDTNARYLTHEEMIQKLS